MYGAASRRGGCANVQYQQPSRHSWVSGMKTFGENVIRLRRAQKATRAATRLTVVTASASLVQTIAAPEEEHMTKHNGLRIGWIGAGRMGAALATRLLEAGHDVAVYNRTRSKAEALTGAVVVDSPADLADRDVVFTMVGGSDDFKEVAIGPNGVLSRPDCVPRVLVDSTTISQAASDDVRAVAAERGTGVLAAPVSGNAKVVAAGRLTMVVSGPEPAYREAKELLELLAAKVTYVGEGDRARLVKICHNLMLGVVAQTLAEITVLAEKGGVSRADFFAFLNDSVMGSMFTRYKTPAYVNLDFKPTFTPQLLLKDFRLGSDAAREHEIPMPVSSAAEQVVQALVGRGDEDIDFAVLLELQAQLSGLELVSEDAPVTDGLRDEVRVA
jgi:3-hydroxyisobutyrate dehydrogenase-like beta-hydroxyacid dehydrogenase